MNADGMELGMAQEGGGAVDEQTHLLVYAERLDLDVRERKRGNIAIGFVERHQAGCELFAYLVR